MRLDMRLSDASAGPVVRTIYVTLHQSDLLREVAAVVETAKLSGTRVAFVVTDSDIVNSFIQSLPDADFVVCVPKNQE